MNKLTFTAAACLLLAGTALSPVMAQSVGEKTGANSVMGIAPSTPDFVKEAAMSDMFEIQASRMAETKGDADTKTFAAKMVNDHQQTSAQLKKIVDNGGVNVKLPTELDASHQRMLTKLATLNGADFNKEYRSEQLGAHKDAVSLFQRYAKSGDNADLKNWASQTLPHLQDHLQMAQSMENMTGSGN